MSGVSNITVHLGDGWIEYVCADGSSERLDVPRNEYKGYHQMDFQFAALLMIREQHKRILALENQVLYNS